MLSLSQITTVAGASGKAATSCRNHLRPFFGNRAIEKIGPAEIRRWQTQLAANTGHATLQQCRSLLLRTFQYAVDEGAIDTNPVRKVPVPKRRADPDQVLGQARRRALTPSEAGQLLARFPLFWWDHVLTLLGTGLRFGELAGLRRRRLHLDCTPPVLQVVTSGTRRADLAAASSRDPKGQSPAVFAGDWPPAGDATSGDATLQGKTGPPPGARLWRSFGVRLAGAGVEPGEAELAVRGQGCGACQRSSKRRRRFHQASNSCTPGGALQRKLSDGPRQQEWSQPPRRV